MPSPFPGMNPYLEQPGVWRDFHTRFNIYAAEQLAQQVMPRYYVHVEENVFFHPPFREEEQQLLGIADVVLRPGTDAPSHQSAATAIAAPATVQLETEIETVPEPYLQVIDRRSGSIVTVIELLSPTNKAAGEDREAYKLKRLRLLKSPTNLVEIDFVRLGKPMPAKNRPTCDYSVFVSRAADRPDVKFWPVGLRDALPTIPIPLHEGDADATLDPRAILDRVYDIAGYGYYIYKHSPVPPLRPEDQAWAEGLVRTAELTPGS